VRPDVQRWLARRTSAATAFSLVALLAAKGSNRISVVLPALAAEDTVGEIVEAIRAELMDRCPLVDELVVVDSGSTDRTAARARAAGARVVHRSDILPELESLPGKGEVLWRSLAVTNGDVIVFIDSDLRSFDVSYVTGLLGPLLTDRTVALVKALYDRPLHAGDELLPGGGGRVTELVARPLLNLHWPELAGVVQPLAGVELALLVDTLAVAGLDAIAQVDLGVRRHHHQSDARLGLMASEIIQVALRRLEGQGRIRLRGPLNPTLAQFSRPAGSSATPAFTTYDVELVERPPMATVPGYAAARATRRRQAS
jgi:glucosyl-3-phosphoglycerate synthase